MSIRLKELTLHSGVFQSPMAACTDLPFRLIAREKGMEFAFLEMVSAHALAQNNKKTLGLMKTVPRDKPLGAQLVGCDPETMAEAAAKVEEMGFDLLDLNLGCPVPKITAGGDGAGSALLMQPQKAEAIFKSVVNAVKRIPVTVKMRLGYKDASGKEAIDISKRAENAGVSAIAVHGRTRDQKYSGHADYEAIGRIVKSVKIPVIGNGDVLCAEDALRLARISGCAGVMLGRGALGNPWIYKEIEAALKGNVYKRHAPSLEERRQTLLRHLELEVHFEGEFYAVRKMRRIACWYFTGVPGAAALRKRICDASTTAAMSEMIADFTPTTAPAGGTN